MTSNLRLFLLLLGVIVLVAAFQPGGVEPPVTPVYATTPSQGMPLLYVSPEGRDDAKGAPDAPLATLAEAIRRVEAKPGGVIRLMPGTYRERVRITARATEERPLVIEGARDASGQWLSIVDGSHSLDPSRWQLRSDLGPGVYAYPGESPRLVLLNDRMVAHLDYRALERAPVNKERSQMEDVLAWPEDCRHTHRYLPIPFWKTLGGVYASTRDGSGFYLRLAGGLDPARQSVDIASEGAVIAIESGAEHVIVRNLLIKGSEYAVMISGPDTSDNLVEGCYIPNGRRRIVVAEGATRTTIRNNRIEMGFIGTRTGAWGLSYSGGEEITGEDQLDAAKKAFVYNFFKYWASPHQNSDDTSIRILSGARDTRVEGNLLDGGLQGVNFNGAEGVVEVIGNTIRRMSSTGTAASSGGSYRVIYDGNTFSDCNINIRLHRLNEPGRREIYILRNVSIQRENRGTHIFCHFHHQTEQTPEHLIAVYHNTFLGGARGLVTPPAKTPEQALRGFQVVNNQWIGCETVLRPNKITAGEGMFGHFDYNRIAPAHFGRVGMPLWFGSHNIMNDEATGWSWKALSYQAPADDPGQGHGIDLSQPYELDGKRYPPLPGLKPGYFHGSHPDPGAPSNRKSASLH